MPWGMLHERPPRPNMDFFDFESSVPLKRDTTFQGVDWGGVKSLCLEGFEAGSGKKADELINPCRRLLAGILINARRVIGRVFYHLTTDCSCMQIVPPLLVAATKKSQTVCFCLLVCLPACLPD